VALQERISAEENARLVGTETELLVAEGEGRKDGERRRLSGRAPDNRLVHFAVEEGAEEPRPGDMVRVGITYAAPHHLVADSGVRGLRRTRAGDAWAARNGVAEESAKPGVMLGMPSIGAPAPAPAATGGCCDACPGPPLSPPGRGRLLLPAPSRKARTSPATTAASWTGSQPNPMPAPARRRAGTPRPGASRGPSRRATGRRVAMDA